MTTLSLQSQGCLALEFILQHLSFTIAVTTCVRQDQALELHYEGQEL